MLDRVSVSVLQLRLEAIVREMGEATLRTASSQILNSGRDFSTAVCDGEGRLTARAAPVPVRVGATPWACKRLASFSEGVSGQRTCSCSTSLSTGATIGRT